MNRPLESLKALLTGAWKAITRITGMMHWPLLGRWLGAILYPAELASLPLMAAGHSTEIMIGRLA